MARDGYKDTVRDPLTGRRREIREADYTINGDVNVVGNLTQNGAAVGGGSVTLETPTGDIDGVNDEFVFTTPPIFVTYQGVIQTLTVDYTLVGSTVTFAVPPVSGLVQGLVSA